MKKHLLPLLFLPFVASGQLFDNTWILGYNNDTITTNYNGIQVLTFPEGRLNIEQNTQLMRFNFDVTAAGLSDSSGQVLSYTNGVHMGNANWEIMENGSFLTNAFEIQGEVWPQWFLGLPWPGHPDKQIYFFEKDTFNSQVSFFASKARFCVVDISQNAGLGAVSLRDSLLIADTLSLGKLTAVRHANGRDWWILINKENSNQFYRVLLDPTGPHVLDKQAVGAKVVDGVGQAVFSPDGTHFAIYNAISPSQGAYIDLYDFDRCSGLLSNHRQFHFASNDWGGCAISPNSRFLYINYFTKAYQYDLWAPDVWASRVLIAEYNAAIDPLANTFFFMQLAPDGKIYSSSTTAFLTYHVIQQPDEPGLKCQFQQHGIQLATGNAFTVPNYPNYRLGPLDGSACDSLGLDNLPIAWWRSESDTTESLHVFFHDLSYYNPGEWTWDFGDGSPGSLQRHPEHTFPGPGEYQVCLTVKNNNATNTLCRILHFTSSASDNPDITERISVAPNPFQDVLFINLNLPLRAPVFRLFDQTGRLLRTQALSLGATELELRDLQPGMFFWEIIADMKGRERIKSGKLVKGL